MASGAGQTETANALGLNRSSVCKWTQHPAFAQALEHAQQSIRETVITRLESLVPLALNALERDLTDPATPPGLRQRAALEILSRAGFAAPSTTNAVAVGVTVNSTTAGWNLGALSDEELSRLGELSLKARAGDNVSGGGVE